MISVVIPTYNRLQILLKALRALEKQTLNKGEFEVIVVDDGSTDETAKIIPDLLVAIGFSAKYLRQDNCGPGVARNFGVKEARGEFICFIGDDIITTPNFLAEHLLVLQNNPTVAVIGRTDWHPDLEVTEFMNFLAPHGPQFDYDGIVDPNNAGYANFITANVSLAKKWLKQEQFPEASPYAAYEDTVLGYRLERLGLKILYRPKALAYHDHSYADPDKFFIRQQNAGRAAKILLGVEPRLKSRLICRKMIALVYYFFLAKLSAECRRFSLACRILNWHYLLRYNFFVGFLSQTHKS